jgi:invasion protein IalB
MPIHRRALAGMFLLGICSRGQSPVEDALRRQQNWQIRCIPKGCIASVDILRGAGDNSPDQKDDDQYISIAVGMNRSDQKVSLLSFEVDPHADRAAGVYLLFLKTTQIDGKWDLEKDKDGPMRFELNRCTEDTCDAVVPNCAAVVAKMQSMDHVMVMYYRGGKHFTTMVSLSLFREAYVKLQEQARERSVTPAVPSPRR